MILLNPVKTRSDQILFYNSIQAGEPFFEDFVEGNRYSLHEILIPDINTHRVLIISSNDFFWSGIILGDVLIFNTTQRKVDEGLFIVQDVHQIAVTDPKNYSKHQMVKGKVATRIRFFKTPFSWMNIPNHFFHSHFPNGVDYNLTNLLIKDPANTFLLKVEGDSMLQADIMENDIVIVRTDVVPKDRDIVVAYVQGGYTLKRLGISRIPELIPENKKYEKILMTDPELDRIQGVIIGVIRNY